jgi:thioredoxin reductase (NADPH)
VEEVIGETHVTGLRVRNMLDDSVQDVAADALFVAIGHTPNTGVFEGQLDLDERGYVVSPDGTSTNAEGVFVAGDVNDHRYRQAVTAAGAGCRAAMDAEKFLEALEFKVDSLAPL